jgi:hypothetical protein
MNMASGVATEYVDLEHQVIRQQIDLTRADGAFPTVEVTPGDPGSEFTPGERQLDREEIAQLVYYRRFASVYYKTVLDETETFGNTIFDASIGINGDLFRPVTTENVINSAFSVDTGGEIGLLDNYTLTAAPVENNTAGGYVQFAEFAIDFYDWPTGGPIVDSFDTITAGFAADNTADAESQIELRYDFWWDVAEQGRSTNPFGRPSTR